MKTFNPGDLVQIGPQAYGRREPPFAIVISDDCVDLYAKVFVLCGEDYSGVNEIRKWAKKLVVLVEF